MSETRNRNSSKPREIKQITNCYKSEILQNSFCTSIHMPPIHIPQMSLTKVLLPRILNELEKQQNFQKLKKKIIKVVEI